MEAARRLLGCRLLSSVQGETAAGFIVETEAYPGPHDPASHAATRIGRTARNASMFGPAGTAYVYLIYGMHWCLNVVTGHEGHPAAVLIRALEPESGVSRMIERRGRDSLLCAGPGRLCQALGVDGTLDGHDLSRPPLRLEEEPPVEEHRVGVSGRIGVRLAAERPYRFFLRDSDHVSPARNVPVIPLQEPRP